VLTQPERAHLRDVRAVFGGLAVLVAGALVVLALALARARSASWTWRSIRAGAVALLGATVLLGAVAGLAFDQAFEVFHRLFFAGGTYTFDPRTDRLVQLFPGQLWFETSLAAGGLMALLALGVAWWAGRRAGRVAAARDEAVAQAGATAGRGAPA